jgi:uncharacterized protein (DUF58 family)
LATSSNLRDHPLRRWLFWFYHGGTGLNHFLRRRLRPAGIALLIIGVVLGFLAGGDASEAVFRLFCFGFAVGALALSSLPLRRVRLEVERELPPHATVGQEVAVHYRVRNRGKHRVHNAWLVETAPDSRPEPEQFAWAREPGGEGRNAFDRFFSYYTWIWLCESLRLFEALPAAESLDLGAGESRRYSTSLVPLRRGLVWLHDLRVLLPDPLGLYQRCSKVSSPPATLVVLPERYRLPEFDLPGAARFQPGGDATSRQMGTSGEFVGLRDYQPGDPLRLIHWASWARAGKPIVKELEDTFFPRHGLILDTYPEGTDLELFEAGVSVAASFVSAIDNRESLIELMFIAGEARVITAGGGTAKSEALLEALAVVQASSEPCLGSLRSLVLRHAEDLAGCLVIFSGWSAEREVFLKSLKAAGIAVAAVVVCRERQTAAVPGVHFVHLKQLGKDLMNLPRHLE